MNSEITIKVTKSFKQTLKPLYKKYPSLKNELSALEKTLLKNPFFGTPLGADIFKIRIGIKSKGKGKSGGARVISFVQHEVIIAVDKSNTNIITVNLITIYDKSEISNIMTEELKALITNMKFE